MSNSFWKKQLTRKLQSPVRRNDPNDREPRPIRVAILGIGNDLNGDDAAGVEVIRSLRRRLSGHPEFLLIEAGPAPENFTGPIRHFDPDLVLLVDAVNMDSPAGTIVCLDWDQISGYSASTHRLPPTVFGSFLLNDLNCPFTLLGIQAGSVEFDTLPCREVKKSIRSVANGLVDLLSHFPNF